MTYPLSSHQDQLNSFVFRLVRQHTKGDNPLSYLMQNVPYTDLLLLVSLFPSWGLPHCIYRTTQAQDGFYVVQATGVLSVIKVHNILNALFKDNTLHRGFT